MRCRAFSLITSRAGEANLLALWTNMEALRVSRSFAMTTPSGILSPATLPMISNNWQVLEPGAAQISRIQESCLISGKQSGGSMLTVSWRWTLPHSVIVTRNE